MKLRMMLLALVSLVSAASAKVVYNADLTVPATNVTNPCTGAPLVFSGTIHALVGINSDSNGVHVLSHINSEGLTATDQATGNVYHFFVQDGTTNFDAATAPDGNFRIIGQEVPAGSEGDDDSGAGFTFESALILVLNPDGSFNHLRVDRFAAFACMTP